MLKEERQDRILHKLSTFGKVVASRLAIDLNVSEDTIRRDLTELEQKNLLKKVYGGALPLDRPVVDYLDRENKDLDLKQKLVEKALFLLKNDQFIAIDGSSTNLQLSKNLPKDIRLTILTNSYSIAQVCSMNPNFDILMLGGTLMRESMANVGDVAAEQAKRYHPELCFMGVYGVDSEYGLTIPYQSEVSIKRQLVLSSSKVVSFVAPAKLNTISKFQVCGIEAITTIITDDTVSQETLNAYKHKGIDCIN